MSATALRLRDLPAGARLGITCLLLVNLGGFVAAAAHLFEHHGPRDGKQGFSLDDVRGAYHGIARRAPLLEVLEAGHPDEFDAGALQAEEREFLLGWLRSERITEDYDDLDLDPPPADVLDQSCLPCHSRKASAPLRADPVLDYWDDVKPVAFSTEVAPTSTAILVASTHTHAIALATIGLLLLLLLHLTAWTPRLTGPLSFLMGLGLLVDLGAMWLTRLSTAYAWLIAAGGTLFSGAVVLATFMLLVDLWRSTPSTKP
jgi:hypothetical protein